MATFVSAVRNQEARTTNNMKARKSTANPCVDLYYNIGASRGQDILPDFVAAYTQDRNLALRIALWARDARGGAGERQLFRNILLALEKMDTDAALRFIPKIPELGRWDDLLVFTDPVLKIKAYDLIRQALEAKNGLCAKWMPRKGKIATELSEFLGYGTQLLEVLVSKKDSADGIPQKTGRYIRAQSKAYRQMLTRLSKVVETQMCARDWDNINFSHVPSVAAARYKKAFARHTPKYAEYVSLLANPEAAKEAGVYVNAGAVYPYDVLKGLITGESSWGYNNHNKSYSKTELGHIQAQWDALPNFIGNANILPIVDVSGSMTSRVGGPKSKTELTSLEVAVSMGLYCADKNTGRFNGTFLTFSGKPELLALSGNIIQKIEQMSTSHWEMNTNLHAAFEKILKVAKQGDVPEEEMPDMLLILSDMQFDQCTTYDDSAIEMIRRKYEEAGYNLPKIVFWNLNAHGNVPVKHNENGVALVSGFSPVVVKSLLAVAETPEKFTPENIMLETVMKSRYDF